MLELPPTETLPNDATRQTRSDRSRRADWRVAAARCHEMGITLRGAEPPSEAPRLAQEPRAAVLAELLAAAVCHSTNWDRLRRDVAAFADANDSFTAGQLASLKFETFRTTLGASFGDDSLGSRYRLFVETAAVIATGSVIRPDQLLDSAVRLGGPTGLYERLRRIPAFGHDPEAKKARLVVQELCRTRLITPADPLSVRPAIEYHLIRLYLRTQRIVPTRRKDEARLRTSSTFYASVITRIRRAVEQAMYYTASAARLPIADLNFLEWQIARSYCRASEPRCDRQPHPDKPCDAAVMALSNGVGCPFRTTCAATRDAKLAQIVEPQLSARYNFY